MQWWHSKVLKAGCSVRKIFKSRIWNTQAASYDFWAWTSKILRRPTSCASW